MDVFTKFTKKSVAIYTILFLLIVLLVTVLLTQHKQSYEQHAAGTSIYPANIDYEGISNYGNYNPAALSNPNVGAVDISLNWSQVEPNPGVFNWAPADNVMADWSAAGKKYTIVVRFANEGGSCSNNQLTPAWELAKIPNFCDTDYGNIIPDYFNPTFKADWKAYILALGAHIATSPYKNNLLYIRIAVGLGGEGFPLSQKGDYLTVDKPQLVVWGYTPTVWAAWQEEMLTSYKTSLPFATIIYPLNGLDTDPATGLPVQIEVAKWAAPQGFGLGQQGLQPGTNAPIFQQLRSQYPNMFIQYQTVYALSKNVTHSCDISCVAQADIQAAEKNGAQFIEWYSQDIINTTLQSNFAAWQQYVDSKFGGGGTPTSTPSVSATPAPTEISGTPTPGKSSSFSLTICPHGLGSCGDNVSSSSGGNMTPLHTSRNLTVTIIDSTNHQIAGSPFTGEVQYVSSAQNFQGIVTIPNITNGLYILSIKMDGYLSKQIPGIISVTQGQHISLPEVALITGDINNDDQLDLLDYNALISCYGTKITSQSCMYAPTASSPGADILDDGPGNSDPNKSDPPVDGGDYNEFLRELSVQTGQ